MPPSPTFLRTHWIACVFAAILAGGLLVRLALAPMEGNRFDVRVNQGWAKSAVMLGMATSYRDQVDGNMLPNYPPFSMMIFAATGHAFQTLVSSDFDSSLPIFRTIIKLPGILADLLTVIALFVIVRKWKSPKAGLLAAALFAFHPAAIYESAVWGQTDSIHSLLALLAMAFLAWDMPFFLGITAVLAVLAKAQAVIFLPFLGLPLLSYPRKVLQAVIGGGATLLAVLLPFVFGGSMMRIVHVYRTSVGYYPSLSRNAYNVWWGLFSHTAGTKPDTDLFFGLLSYRTVGLALFAASLIAIAIAGRKFLWAKDRKNKFTGQFLCGSLAAFAFFMLNTEMHERYLFPFVTVGLPLLFLHRRSASLYILACVAFVINLLGVVPFSFIDKAIYTEFPAFDVLIAVLQLVIFGWLFAFAFKADRLVGVTAHAASLREHSYSPA